MWQLGATGIWLPMTATWLTKTYVLSLHSCHPEWIPWLILSFRIALYKNDPTNKIILVNDIIPYTEPTHLFVHLSIDVHNCSNRSLHHLHTSGHDWHCRPTIYNRIQPKNHWPLRHRPNSEGSLKKSNSFCSSWRFQKNRIFGVMLAHLIIMMCHACDEAGRPFWSFGAWSPGSQTHTRPLARCSMCPSAWSISIYISNEMETQTFKANGGMNPNFFRPTECTQLHILA